jgi:hypothetical protein
VSFSGIASAKLKLSVGSLSILTVVLVAGVNAAVPFGKRPPGVYLHMRASESVTVHGYDHAGNATARDLGGDALHAVFLLETNPPADAAQGM